jgi:hypothetical protein
MTTNSDPALDDIDPVANPNRDVTLGMSVQRGLRIRIPATVPTAAYLADYPGLVISADRLFGGITYRERQDPRFFNGEIDSQMSIQSPNETRVIDYFPTSFFNQGIYFVTDGLQSRLDAAGDRVPLCAAADDLGCDLVDSALDVLRPGADHILQAVPVAGEFYSRRHPLCSAPSLPVTYMYFTEADMNTLRRHVVGHEGGHGVDMEHDGKPCNDLMEGKPSGYPLPDDYSPLDRDELRTHRKF